MPDWFYRTVSRPMLFRLPAATSRDVALGFMGRLARLPLGAQLIDFLGHMRADPRLHRSFLGIDFPTTIGLGPDLDSGAVALPALVRFGFGFLEIGPVTCAGSTGGPAVKRRPGCEAVWFPDPPWSLGCQSALPKIREAARWGMPLIVRLGYGASTPEQSAAEFRGVIQELLPFVSLFSLQGLEPALMQGSSTEQWSAYVATAVQAAGSRPILVCLTADVETAKAKHLLDAARTAGAAGFLVDGSIRGEAGGRLVGLPARAPALTRVQQLRQDYGDGVLLVAAGGVHEPEDGLALHAAGADLVQVDSGLIYTGPGLPKRINEAFLFQATRRPAAVQGAERPAEMTWFWTALLGGGMFVGSVLALVIDATGVVLAYDEAFVGMTRQELASINPRLLPFMSHDRVSLAGTMIAIGVMYLGLSLFGVRQGLHWARQAIFISAFTGFASFFLFLGFGYLDTFHAFVTAILMQLLLLGLHARLGTYVPRIAPALRGERAWRCSLWGQLLLIIHGLALLGAGTVISTIGVTCVFVAEDLDFMRTTAQALAAANPRLVPLVAHDRATFGGMLLASGWAFLLPALWGFRNGSAWLWWTMLIAGLAAYAAALGVHYAVGYTHLMHLLPAFGGLWLFSAGMALSYAYLADPSGPDLLSAKADEP